MSAPMWTRLEFMARLLLVDANWSLPWMRVGGRSGNCFKFRPKIAPDGLSSNSHSASNRCQGRSASPGCKATGCSRCFALLIVESRFASDAFIILHFDIQGRCSRVSSEVSPILY